MVTEIWSFSVPEHVSHADLILFILPVLFFGMCGIGVLATGAWSVSIALASIICCLLIADGLFWHPPHEW
jgi:hypothetical protein